MGQRRKRTPIEVDPNLPCPCGSTKLRGKDCCVRRRKFTQTDPDDGSVLFHGDIWAFEKAAAATKPRGPKTGYAHPKCYAASLLDCSTKITGEHTFTHDILKQIANAKGMVGVGGLPHLEAGAQDMSIATMKANVLCSRHNSVLTSLDTAASGLFEFEYTYGAKLEAGRDVRFGVCGYDIERWSLKWLCGNLAIRKQAISDRWLRILFGEDEIVQPAGLYQYVREGDVANVGSRFAELMIATDADGSPIGCRISLMNRAFVVSLTSTVPQQSTDAHKWRIFRPSGTRIHYPRKNTHAVCAFSWPGAPSIGATYDIIYSPTI